MVPVIFGSGATLALLASVVVWQYAWSVSHSGIHELLAAVLLLTAAVLFTGWAILAQVVQVAHHLATLAAPPAAPPRAGRPDRTPSYLVPGSQDR
jgi:hypothetical protein